MADSACLGWGAVRPKPIARDWRVYKFVFLLADHQDGAGGVTYHVFHHAPQEHVFQAGASMGGDDDQVDGFESRDIDNLGFR